MIYRHEKVSAHKSAKKLLEELKKKNIKAIKVPMGVMAEFKNPKKNNDTIIKH